MNEENECADSADRQSDGESHSKAWNKFALAAANRAQYDQTIGEYSGENAEHDLSDAITHEVPQYARGVLARG